MKTYPLYLNGEFVQSEPAWNVINPATGEAFCPHQHDRPRTGWSRPSLMRTRHSPAGDV